LRGHNSQRNFGGKDFHNRRGGSFSSGGGNYQNNFRNRNQHANRSARQDSTAANAKDGAASSFGSIGKENRRTLTDFKIVGLKIPEIDWIWGIQPDIGLEMKEPTKLVSTATVKKEVTEDQKSLGATSEIASLGEDTKHSTGVSISANTVDAETATDKKASASSTLVPCLSTSLPDSNQNSPPPSRMRIYFHTPVTADDSRPIPHSSSFYGETSVSSDSRKGKRKKLEDDDGDIEEGRVAPPPPPQMGNGFGNSVINANDDRSSVAGSVAPSVPETGSEDWLMAAIVEGEEEAEAEVELRLHDEENEDEEQMNLHADLFVSKSTDEGAIADDGKFDGKCSFHFSTRGWCLSHRAGPCPGIWSCLLLHETDKIPSSLCFFFKGNHITAKVVMILSWGHKV
jgi:20S proteasome subunit alpha 6